MEKKKKRKPQRETPSYKHFLQGILSMLLRYLLAAKEGRQQTKYLSTHKC